MEKPLCEIFCSTTPVPVSALELSSWLPSEKTGSKLYHILLNFSAMSLVLKLHYNFCRKSDGYLHSLRKIKRWLFYAKPLIGVEPELRRL
jgi:hypothetical protein